MSLDHGLLNIPLARRGDIDAGIDRYKREQAAAAKAKQKAAAAAHRELKEQARVALAELILAPGLLDTKANKLGISRRKLTVLLADWAKWQPAKVIKARAEWLG